MTPTTAFEQRDALVVSATFLRTAFGGASSAYSLWLGQPCTSVVVVHLLLPSDAIGSVRLSSDRLCFTPDTFAQPQIVRVEALENRQQWSVITHRLYSLDRNYDRVVTPNVVVQTEVTPLECPLLTFGGLTTKRKAATKDSSTRLDILAALPKDTTNEAAEGGAAVDASWCMSHLASGYHFSVAAVVQPKGTTLLSWGLNTNGELGNGTMTSSPTPQQVITLPLQLQREPLTVAHVSCGKHHVAVITGQARLFTWGCNKYGQLGLGDFSPRTQPHEVYFALATLSSHRRALRVMHTVQRAGNNVTHVACGAAHTLFVTHQQQILGMGYNQAGQLGLGHRLQQHKGWRSCTPIAVESLRDQSILDLAAGQNHSACALSNGDVYTWGCGDDGRLGDGKLGEGVATPTLIKLLREVSVRARSVRCGARHMAVISDCDLLYIWGANDFGQLGCKDDRSRSRPFLLATPSLFTEGVEDVALGEFHTTCVTCAGKAYTWGLNLRDNNALVGSDASPQVIDLPEKERVRRISCGWTHTNIVTYISADEASVSGQGANFDRKIERERINQRKAEVARWRAFVTAAISSTSRETRRGDREQKSPIQKAVKTTKNVKSTAKGIAEQTEAVQEIEASLEKLSVSYSNQAMEDAVRNVAQVIRTARRTCTRSARSRRSSNNSLKGVFYQNQLRPPEVPAATECSPPSIATGRKLCSAPVGTLSRPDWQPVPMCAPFYPTPPARGRLKLSDQGPLDPKQDESSVPAKSGEGDVNALTRRSARSPTVFRRTATPSPRSRVTVVEALLHRPTFSITRGALTSARSRSQSK
ncbi:hypothetical protein PC129_g5872 [Phytophthora cactorum]|uniref:RCC1-like domain-containing protein n=1 Tax=Phytophthora cactorum TaxID=29920 RepID=A0A329SBK0_9STRA|nr:hypothetical protein Pcac1_g27280 [Phytophthora cactorum]KAG2826585.1 hypothetical protein PC111_g8920 [Phytophthora cactorum]KAG2831308.1 hypothetical protein PC112_g7317 [Phytophthora cactorum]KAG2866500.1 hypothetical protein PC113_g2774 [Phytophthora cactorum]KAG2903794.1 hypothetical protein PC115_g15201 [Phytophthora cactorum]